MIQAGYVRSTERRPYRAATSFAPPPEPVPARAGSAYGAVRQPRWVVMAAILFAHVALLAALVMLDVIPLSGKPKPRLTLVELRAEPVVPDVAPPPQQKAAPDKPPPAAQTPVVAPPPIVPVAAPVAAVPVAPPPASPAPSAPPAAAAPVSDAAPAISPPDASARSLGNPAPRYPIDARRNHWEGVVRLRVVITPEGRVKEIAVARSSGFDTLDQEALGTVRRWRFRPGMQAGVAVEAVGFLNIPFRLT